MSNAQSNPPRREQEEQARQSPLKQPQTETAHADKADVGQAANAHQDGPRSPGDAQQNDAGPYGNQSESPRKQAAYPEDVHPRGVDVDNDNASDSTLDTDGKDRDAKRLGRLDDSEVVSNASSDNATLPPAEGLAGIDSRPHGNRAEVLAEPGKAVIDEGFTERAELYETAGDGSDAEALNKQNEHVPPNHTRVGHKIRIEAKG